MSNDLQLTQNAQFYRPDSAVTDALRIAILDAASSNMTQGSQFVDNVMSQAATLADGSPYIFSLRVFETVREVHFWKAPLKDKVYAFILIVEIDDCIVVFKKSCASIAECMEKNANLIRSTELTSAFSDTDAQFQKMTMRNMTVSDRAMRSRAFEASDLKGLMSLHSAGRSIPYFFKLKVKGRSKTISAQSGRVVEASERKSIADAVTWAKAQLHDINNPSQDKEFLDSFARLVDLDSVWAATTPNGVLLEHNIFTENIVNQSIPVFYTGKRGRVFELKDKHLKNLISEMEKVYEVGPTPGFELQGSIHRASLRKNLNSITLDSPILRKIHFEQNGKPVTLQAYIKKQNMPTITFNDPRYMYFMGQCFEDGAGVNEIPELLKTLTILPALANATSEKGSFTKRITKFDADSVFDIVEQAHQADDYIFCDDLGNEWADHITFNLAEISVSFIHSKHGEPSKSASNLHDVVGQALKNIGNMDVDIKKTLEKYTKKFKTTYRGGKISRIRKRAPGRFEAYLPKIHSDFRFNRRCIICCSFISKKVITREFNKIKNGRPVAGYTTQLYWILSSFINATKEAGVHPIVYCRA